ncbi:MAG: glycine betaine catabolism, partial [Mycobacterium sp.]|nr:glycine betaine catabolism [Mycobacterium sp.]
MRADATMMTSHQPAPVPGVRRGWALPSAAYHDPAIFRRELTDVFHGGWLLAATSAQVANPGDTLTWTVG